MPGASRNNLWLHAIKIALKKTPVLLSKPSVHLFLLHQAKNLTLSALAEFSKVPRQPYDPKKNELLPLHKKIDHTLLKPEATEAAIHKLCQEALTYDFYSVCVSPHFVKLAQKFLKNSTVKVISVVGFPTGLNPTSVKVNETRQIIQDGAEEVDMVLNISALKNKDYVFVLNDIQKVVEAAHPHPVKVILETCLLTDDEKLIACALTQAAGAHYVKTSTGFSTGGATLKDIELMKKTVGDKLGIKASGGIQTIEQAQAFLHAGATRLGTSSGVHLIQKSEGKNESY